MGIVLYLPAMARLRNALAWVNSTEGRVLLAILILGTFLRVGRLAEAVAAPDFAYPAIDAGFNDYWARSLAIDGWMPPAHLPDPEIATSPCLRPPGYPWFLAATYAVTGGSYLAPRVLQCLLGLATAALIYALGRRWFGSAAGLLAAALFATHWVPLYFETELHEPALLMFILVALAGLWERWARFPSAGRAAVAGLVTGIAALVRSNILLGLPFLALWMFTVLRRRVRVGDEGEEAVSSTSIPNLAAAFLGLALALAPATARNFAASGELVLVSSNAGLNLLLGNHARATGLIGNEIPGLGAFDNFYDYPAILRALERREGHALTHGEASSLFASEALHFVSGSPGEFIALTVRKAGLFWGPAEISHNKVLALERSASPILSRLPGPFPFYLAAAMVGLLQHLWRRRSQSQGFSPMMVWVAGFLLLWFLSVLPFFAAARYRLPVLPFLMLLGSQALVSTWKDLWARRFRGGLASVGVFLLLLLITGASSMRLPPNRAKWHMDRGHAFERAGRGVEAASEFQAALRESPAAPDAHYSVALQAASAGDPVTAEEHYRATLEADVDHAGALTNLGSLLVGRGQFEEGLALLEAALARDPDLSDLRHNLALALRLAGRPREAVEHWRAILLRDPDSVPTHKALASTLIAMGDPSAAILHLEQAVELEPERLEHRNELAWILATSPDETVRDGVRAETLARSLIEVGGDKPIWLATLAAALAERGDFVGARAVVQRAIDIAVSSGKQRRVKSLRASMDLYRNNRPLRSNP
jgi:tetratricopeptide (TPR) repeat protein